MNFPRRAATAVLVMTTLALAACGQTKEQTASSQLQKALGAPTVKADESVTKAVVRTWPARFCSLKLRMSRSEVRKVMGKPTSSYSNSAENQDQWSGWGIELTAFYDMNDKARQLDDSTGEADLPCGEETRTTG